MQLILASASPRRTELLANAGFEFEAVPAHIDETPRRGEGPADYVRRLASEKASAIAGRGCGGHRPILAADTAVIVDGAILLKPVDDRHARSMLTRLSGREHEVLTGVALVAGPHCAAEVVATRVRFVTLSDAEIEWYVASGEPEGKAGAYAIQGLGSRFVESIDGSWSNVVGLPVATVYRLLKEAGVVC